MAKQILLLDRVEFGTVKVESNPGEFKRDEVFFQLALEGDEPPFLTRSDLIYPPDQIEDPRHFMLTYGVKISHGNAEGQPLPYDIEIEAAGYFRYVGGDELKEENRFRAVRFSGYQILYGAIREMVSNITARGCHGLWHLPARNFGAIAESRANDDEARRKQALAEKTRPVVAAPKKRVKKLGMKGVK